jgi:hypothetical protein
MTGGSFIPDEWTQHAVDELKRRSSAIPPPDPDWRPRRGWRARARLRRLRERVALRVAPWLRRRDD